MGVDPATVRIALKQLEAMNVLEIRRSDGAYVKDFQTEAGLDFLVTLIVCERMDGEEPVTDEYLSNEIHEFWLVLWPAMMNMANPKYTPKHIKAFIEIFDEELEAIGDVQKVVDLELQSQDLVVEVADNTLATLLFNSLRPLRRRMAKLFALSVAEEDQREYLLLRKEMARRGLAGTVSDADHENYLEKTRAAFRSQHQAIQQRIFEGITKPSSR
jgi:DNA-binding FadR family transcriptional regulator